MSPYRSTYWLQAAYDAKDWAACSRLVPAIKVLQPLPVQPLMRNPCRSPACNHPLAL